MSTTNNNNGKRPTAELKRSDVGKRVRIHADRLRRSVMDVIDATGEPQDATDFVTAFRQLRKDWGEVEAALKDWDNLNPREDSCDDLDWRQRANASTKELAKELSKQLDQHIPEHGVAQKLAAQKRLSAHASLTTGDFELGPVILETLASFNSSLAGTSGNGEGKSNAAPSGSPSSMSSNSEFTWEFVRCSRSLTCIWQKVMHVTLKLSVKGKITSIRVLAIGESSWPSKFDVFRELERQSRRALRDFTMAGNLTTNDELMSNFLSWFNDRKDLFNKPCAQTKSFLAFGAVGEHGELEARPPMQRERNDQSVLEATFETST